jgi:tRNA dimethylallyltransferase
MRAVGYRQGWAYLDGRIGLDQFRIDAIHATRQLAKRQLTWLRAEPDARVLDPGQPRLVDAASHALALFLGRASAA